MTKQKMGKILLLSSNSSDFPTFLLLNNPSLYLHIFLKQAFIFLLNLAFEIINNLLVIILLLIAFCPTLARSLLLDMVLYILSHRVSQEFVFALLKEQWVVLCFSKDLIRTFSFFEVVVVFSEIW